MEDKEEKSKEKNIESFDEVFKKFIEKSEEEISSIKSDFSEIKELYDNFIKKPGVAIPSKAEKLNETFDKVNEYHKEIEEIETKVQEFETKIFGKNSEDEEGLKFKVNSLKEELQELHSYWEEKYTTLSNKIEGLLPGATSAGLAQSYHDQKNSYRFPNILWSIVFIITMIVMVWYAVYTVNQSDGIGNALLNILSRAPFFVPTVWLALFASKQQSQNRRLEQEYAYKESLAKSYDGYKREIEKLPESKEKNEIMERLVNSMVDAAGFNPSSTLERQSHNDKPPILGTWFGRNKRNEQ